MTVDARWAGRSTSMRSTTEDVVSRGKSVSIDDAIARDSAGPGRFSNEGPIPIDHNEVTLYRPQVRVRRHNEYVREIEAAR